MVDEESTVHLLTDLGFCASEAKVYFALSRMDKARIIDVAKIAQLDRAETYRIASKLERKGYLIRMIAHPVEYRSIPMTYLLRSLLKKKKGELIQFEKKATKILQHSLLEDRIQLKKEEYISLIPILEPVFPDVKKDISNVK
jgi:sugar-specific transcriptional regulator TrmB